MQIQTPPSTIHRRAPARGPITHANGIEVTDLDILEAIEDLASKQSTRFVSIARLALALGFTPEDRDWLIGTLKVLDTQYEIALSALERPQDLPLPQQIWYVLNASGIPCHEVAVTASPEPSKRIAPLLRKQAPQPPVFAPAKDTSSDNPHMQKRRVSDLVKSTADLLISFGSRPHTRLRVLHVEQASTKDAAA